MRILLATDGSERSANALVNASQLLAPANRKVDLTCVVPKVPRASEAVHRRLCRRATHVLAKVKALLALEGVEADSRIDTGSPARSLIGASYHYDMTMVSSASRNSVVVEGLGPVASRVAEHAHGAVLLAREGRIESGIRVLAAVDGSDASLEALDRMAALINIGEAEVTLLHVVEAVWLRGAPDEEWLEYQDAASDSDAPEEFLRTTLVKEGEDIVFAARKRVLAASSVRSVIREGTPANEILSEIESGGYDLVVVGASGSDDLKHKILGSVSSKVAWNAPCSVLAVHPLRGEAEDSKE